MNSVFRGLFLLLGSVVGLLAALMILTAIAEKSLGTAAEGAVALVISTVMFSAVKHFGQRTSELADQGESAAPKTRF